jgi:predicted nucleic-acid-binding Zn-ribbon protein
MDFVRSEKSMTDENLASITCPKCGSTEVVKRDHEKHLKRVGGLLATTAGVTAGTVGGAASGASVGAAIGTVAGPLGVIVGGTVGTFVGAISVAITGGVVGNMVGKKAGIAIDKNLFLDYQCAKCNYRFKEKAEKPESNKS